MLLTNIMNNCYNRVISLNFIYMFSNFLNFLGLFGFLRFMYNLHSTYLMKCLNEFFIDFLIFYCVDLKQWTVICSKLMYVSTMETVNCSRFASISR